MGTMPIRGLPLPVATYRRRRAAAVPLVERSLFGTVPLLLLGCDEHHLRRDRQDPWFDYFTGCAEPDAALLIDPLDPEAQDTLFLDPGDPSRIVWDGKRLGPGAEARRAHGVDRVLHRDELTARVLHAAERAGGRIAMCWRTREPGWQSQQAHAWKKRTLAGGDLAGLGIGNAEASLVRLRMIKDADEVALHREAIAITEHGLRTVLPQLASLTTESAVASALTFHYRAPAYGPLAFPPIVGSGVNGATLHYPFNDQPLEPKAPLLIDSGATAGGYCADVTRTIPVHGKFDDRRFREVYELVLRANRLARDIVRPGMTHGEWTKRAWEPIIAAGFVRHHGLSHHIGLDVHDPADYDVPLAPGMILSNEPGIYLPEEGFGIRIEDDLLITADGCEELTRAIPKDIPDVEALMRG